MKCESCKSELPMHRLGCPETKGETALYAKIEELKKALGKYGAHLLSCNYCPCSCGLDQALKG